MFRLKTIAVKSITETRRGHHEYHQNKIKMMAPPEFESESQRPERHRIDQTTPGPFERFNEIIP